MEEAARCSFQVGHSEEPPWDEKNVSVDKHLLKNTFWLLSLFKKDLTQEGMSSCLPGSLSADQMSKNIHTQGMRGLMSILPPLPSLPLTQERLTELLQSQAVTELSLHLLRWLVWFPLLSVEELTRLEQARLAKQAQTRSPQRIAALLQKLETLQLIAHLVINERGWPPHQHRYYLTDAGLYVFAAQVDPPLSVKRLVQAYAVERADLIARLARIDIHLVLAAFSTKLVAEGSALGYPLVSYQQPWIQTDTIFGHRQTVQCDAAFLLTHPQGTEHAFYVRVDTDERRPFDSKRERIPLLGLLNLRHALHLHQETMPCLLIITRASRLCTWGELLEKTSEQQGTALLGGAITTLEQVQHAGVHGPVWCTFAQLTHWMKSDAPVDLPAPPVQLSMLVGAPTSQALAERFSQRQSFAHLMTSCTSDAVRQTSRPLPSFVGKPLSQEITTLRGGFLADALRGTKAEQQEATVLLNLALSASQKDLLFWLTHQQLLTIHQLAALHNPGSRTIQSAQKQMKGLSDLDLLHQCVWTKSRLWHERERYALSESALRYVALREGRPADAYVLPQEQQKSHELFFSIQRGSLGLFRQMDHTHGLYQCMVHLLEGAHREKARIITWKSAHESIRWYRDPITSIPMQIRPDAEVIYLAPGKTMPQSILLEYDRATTSRREYEAKYKSYADYQDYTHLLLPPILVVTQDNRTARLIRACIDTVAMNLVVIIVSEDQIQQQGLLGLLAPLAPQLHF